MWCNLSDNARLQFGWPDPGVPREPLPDEKSMDARDEADFKPDPAPKPTEPADTFALLLLRPARVDQLCLKGFPQRRTVYSREAASQGDGVEEGAWIHQAVNP